MSVLKVVEAIINEKAKNNFDGDTKDIKADLDAGFTINFNSYICQVILDVHISCSICSE